jgi:hypothetical protein
VIDYLRLAFATLVVLAPGRLIARALGQRTTSASLAWGLAALFVSWALVFTVHASIDLQLAVLLGIGAATFLVDVRRREWEVPRRLWLAVCGGGVLLGIALWHVEGPVAGDGLFHEGRVRKLVDLGHLHLRSVDELAKGGLHPGYAFPLWHGFLADVAKLSGLDPGVVVQHEASLLVPLACLVAWESGVALFGSPSGGLGALAAAAGLYCFAAGHGGSWVDLALPPTASRQILLPAVIALFFGYAAAGRLVDLLALSALLGELTLVHSSYGLFLALPLGAYAVVHWRAWRRSLVALVVGFVPVGLVLLWLRPLVDETISHNPTAKTVTSSVAHYCCEIVYTSPTHYRLAADIFSRTGAVSVAALALVPVAGMAVRKRWGAFVLGGSLAVLALTLIPFLFVHFADEVSISQARREAGFIPLPWAFAGAVAVLTRSIFLLPLALIAGIVLQILWPGDFGYGLHHGGPAVVAWWALGAGALALALGFWRGPHGRFERWGRGAAAAGLFVLPVVVYGALHWSPAAPSGPYALSPALQRELKHVPKEAVIIAPAQTAYEIVAHAPVYVVAAPPTHVAVTKANDPRKRVAQVDRWLKGKAPNVPREYGATWAVSRDGRLYKLPT